MIFTLFLFKDFIFRFSHFIILYLDFQYQVFKIFKILFYKFLKVIPLLNEKLCKNY